MSKQALLKFEDLTKSSPISLQLFSHSQWFGNLVTMKWWDDLWLNEAFAELIESMGVELILPGNHKKSRV